ncbi:MAG: hypothetical protein U0T73_05220 [Chitinophagales bacterium]
MGYQVHITRKQSWFDETGSEITMKEWKDFVKSDPELRLDNFIEWSNEDGKILKREIDGLTVWTAYSKNRDGGNQAWIDWNEGNVTVKNPDNEFLLKMCAMAKHLNARVQGDDGEFYTEKMLRQQMANRKKWWHLW